MLKRSLLILVILSAVIASTACGDSSPKAAITGVLAHTHRMALPAGDTVIIRIEDTTKTDAPGKKVAETVIKCQGEVLPIPFAVVYDPGKINPDHSYSIHAEIDDANGKMIFVNDTTVPVLTHGNPARNIKVIVQPPAE